MAMGNLMKSPIHGCFNGEIIYKWGLFNCHIWLAVDIRFELRNAMIWRFGCDCFKKHTIPSHALEPPSAHVLGYGCRAEGPPLLDLFAARLGPWASQEFLQKRYPNMTLPDLRHLAENGDSGDWWRPGNWGWCGESMNIYEHLQWFQCVFGEMVTYMGKRGWQRAPICPGFSTIATRQDWGAMMQVVVRSVAFAWSLYIYIIYIYHYIPVRVIVSVWGFLTMGDPRNHGFQY
jgi:hypothetical protein